MCLVHVCFLWSLSSPPSPACHFLTQELQEENIELKGRMEQMRVELLDQEWTSQGNSLFGEVSEAQTDRPPTQCVRQENAAGEMLDKAATLKSLFPCFHIRNRSAV